MDKEAIGIAGLGLIGGSLARAASSNGYPVYGCDCHQPTMEAAFSSGAVSGTLDAQSLGRCSMVFVALYPGLAIEYIREHIGDFPEGCLVVDLCGVKGPVVSAVSELCRKHGVVFIGGHPMAGREYAGFNYSDKDLFKGGSFIMTPPDWVAEASINKLSLFLQEAGITRITITTPSHHDHMIAYTSQLAHILSSAYVKNPASREHTGYTAGSFRDLTRVARVNADMWTELFLLNRENLLEELDFLLHSLTDYRNALADDDATRLHTLLEEGTAIKDSISR